MTSILQRLKGLRLSASDLKSLTDWSDPVIEEFLSLIDGIDELAGQIDSNTTPEYIDFITGLANPTYKEGRLFWDNGKHSLSYYNDEQDITVNIGQELLIPIHNDTGAIIPNGTLVYPTGVYGNRHTVDLADASEKDKCRLVAMVTHDIENNTNGYATRLGSVSDVDTDGMTGILYLSDTTPGAFTNTIPTKGSFVIPIGAVKESAVDGSITIDVSISELSVEVTDTNGFSNEQRTNTVLSFDESTRTFTLSATAYPFYYYQEGNKVEFNASESIVISDVDGLHVVYFDGGTLNEIANPDEEQVAYAIVNYAIVCYIYWNVTDQIAVPLGDIGDERHGISMSPRTHAYLHFTNGARFMAGGAINNFTADGSGDTDANHQCSINQVSITDEDLFHYTPNITEITDSIPVLYKDGANGYWKEFGSFDSWAPSMVYPAGSYVLALTGNAYDRGLIFYTAAGGTSGASEPTWQDASGAVDADGGNPCGASTTDNTVTWVCVGTTLSRTMNYNGGTYRTAYNEWTGATWQQTEVASGQYTLTHIFMTNFQDNQLIAIQGQSTYLNVIAARAGAATEMNNLVLSDLPTKEYVPLASIIYQTNSAYLNASKSRVRTTDVGENYVDWRYQRLAPGSGPTSHSNLSNLNNRSDHTWALSGEDFTADNQIIVSTGAGTHALESGATARTSLGLGTGDDVVFNSLQIAEDNYIGTPVKTTFLKLDGSNDRLTVEGDIFSSQASKAAILHLSGDDGAEYASGIYLADAGDSGEYWHLGKLNADYGGDPNSLVLTQNGSTEWLKFNSLAGRVDLLKALKLSDTLWFGDSTSSIIPSVNNSYALTIGNSSYNWSGIDLYSRSSNLRGYYNSSSNAYASATATSGTESDVWMVATQGGNTVAIDFKNDDVAPFFAPILGDIDLGTDTYPWEDISLARAINFTEPNSYSTLSTDGTGRIGAYSTSAGLTYIGQGTTADHTFMTRSGSVIMRMDQNRGVFINETSNSFMNIGLTIQQGSYDTEILAFKSSDISHAITNQAEADTYGSFKKGSSAYGGLRITGFTDGDSDDGGLRLQGLLGTNDPTDTYGAVLIDGGKDSTTGGISQLADDETLLHIRNVTTPVISVHGNGNLLLNTGDLNVLDGVVSIYGNGLNIESATPRIHWTDTTYGADAYIYTGNQGNMLYYANNNGLGSGSYHSWFNDSVQQMTLQENGLLGINTPPSSKQTKGGLTIKNTHTATQELLALQHDFGSQPATTYADADTYFLIREVNVSYGGALLEGFTFADYLALRLRGVNGVTSPAYAPVRLEAYKSDGSTGLAAVGNAEKAIDFYNSGVELLTLYGNGDAELSGALDVDGQISSSSLDTGTISTSGHINMLANMSIASAGGNDLTMEDDTISTGINQVLLKSINSIYVGIDHNANTSTAVFEIGADSTSPDTWTRIFQVREDGIVFINELYNTFMDQGLTINQDTASGEIFALKSSSVGHSFTTYHETDTFFAIQKSNATLGGAKLRGFSDGDHTGMNIQGWIGASNPTNAVGAIALVGYEWDGSTGVDPLATSETLIDFQNGGSSVARVMGSGSLFINDSYNSFMTQGITVNQGAYDDEILTFKSSDVAHGATGQTDTDTYAFFKKGSATLGGLRVEGLAEDYYGLRLMSVMGTTSPTYAGIIFQSYKSDGSTGITGLDDDEQIAQFFSGGVDKLSLYGDGSMKLNNDADIYTKQQAAWDLHFGDTTDTDNYGNVWIQGPDNGGVTGGLKVHCRSDAAKAPSAYATFSYNRSDGAAYIGTASDHDALQVATTGLVLMPAVYSNAAGGSARNCFIDPDGTIGYLVSTEKEKTDIKYDPDTDWIHMLKPVEYKRLTDLSKTHYGVIAEEAALVSKGTNLVQWGEKYGSYSPEYVAYEELIGPLLAEVQRLRKEVDYLKSLN